MSSWNIVLSWVEHEKSFITSGLYVYQNIHNYSPAFFFIWIFWPMVLLPCLPMTLVKNAYQKNIFIYFSTKTYVVGTQKNRLNERVLLSTQNICYNWWVRKYLQFYAQKIVYLNLCLPAKLFRESWLPQQKNGLTADLCIRWRLGLFCMFSFFLSVSTGSRSLPPVNE